MTREQAASKANAIAELGNSLPESLQVRLKAQIADALMEACAAEREEWANLIKGIAATLRERPMAGEHGPDCLSQRNKPCDCGAV